MRYAKQRLQCYLKEIVHRLVTLTPMAPVVDLKRFLHLVVQSLDVSFNIFLFRIFYIHV